MKLGILTQPLEENYGGILQAYALQQALLQLGHQPVVINRVSNDAYNRSTYIRMKHFAGRVYRLPQHRSFRRLLRPENYMEQCIRDRLFTHTYRFIRQYIDTSPRLATTQAFLNYIKGNQFDGYIVGSDQCWRPKYSPNIYTYFLDFVSNKSAIKRLAYAASFGVDAWEYSEEETAKCAELIRKFDAVSVREDSGIGLCAEYLQYDNAIQTLDPTLLLNREDYIHRLHLEDFPQSDGNMLTYVLDKSPDKTGVIDQIAQQTGLQPFSVIAPHSYFENECFPLSQCVQPPVEKWLRGFMDAKMVVADSFHGSVFAILFNKPFIAIGNHERGMTRFHSLLKQFQLEDRLIYTPSDINDKLLSSPIDWNKVNETEIKREIHRFS